MAAAVAAAANGPCQESVILVLGEDGNEHRDANPVKGSRSIASIVRVSHHCALLVESLPLTPFSASPFFGRRRSTIIIALAERIAMRFIR
jgi:hypothetical protein